MRLINVKTFELEEHLDAGTGEKGDIRYAILCHRWTSSEVTYKDFIKKRCDRSSVGYSKIIDFCKFIDKYKPSDCEFCLVLTAGFRCFKHDISHVWVDTCCIDKRSSSELSEAINSMWNWYQNAAYCVAHLADVHLSKDKSRFSDEFGKSDWFTRGWTLQELLASDLVIFCSLSWTVFGSKTDPPLTALIEHATGIEAQYLFDASRIRSACIANKFSWAANRKTTRSEDVAYSLLGLMGINMSLL